jgi:hypothetical protein
VAAAAGAGTEGARGTETERRTGGSVGGWRSLRERPEHGCRREERARQRCGGSGWLAGSGERIGLEGGVVALPSEWSSRSEQSESRREPQGDQRVERRGAGGGTEMAVRRVDLRGG